MPRIVSRLCPAMLLVCACGAAMRAETIVFARTAAGDLKLDLRLPEAPKTSRPTILWTGESEPSPALLLQPGRGYAVALLAPRPNANFTGQLHAAKAAVRWLRANAGRFNLDSARIAAWGGPLAAALGVSGGIDELEGALGNEALPSRLQAVVIAPAPGIDPTSYASADDPPFFLLAPDARLETTLREARVEVTTASADADIDDFLDRRLKPARPPAAEPAKPLWMDPDKSEPAGTKYCTFLSPTIRGQVSYLIYLPPDYRTAARRRYPVVYWLHNASGNQRTGAPFVAQLDRAIRARQAPPAIVVLVNGIAQSQYADSADGSQPVETVIVRDLIPHIDKTWRTIATRAGRAVEGFSMGGTGAAKLAFKYPDLFGAVAVDSGGLPDLHAFNSGAAAFRAIYGESARTFQNDSAWTLAERNAARVRGRMLIRVGAGDADPYYDPNHRFHKLLDALGIDHEFAVVPNVTHSLDFYRVLGTDRIASFYCRAFAPGEKFAAPAQGPTIHVVDQRHPRASDDGSGSADRPFRTISRAAEAARSGDTVLVHEGVYRERVSPARGGEPGKPVAYLAARGERVVVKGSEIWRPDWQPFPGRPGVFYGNMDTRTFAGYNPFLLRLDEQKLDARPHEGPRFPRTLGQLFVDGEPFRESETLDDLYAMPRTWMTSPQGDAIYVHFERSPSPPDQHTIEISVRERIFAPHAPGLGYITVRGFTFEHCANPPQAGAVGTPSGQHWIIEDNIIRHAKTVGLDFGGEGPPDAVGRHLVRKNTVTDNGLCGIAGFRNVGTRILANVVQRNSAMGIHVREFAAGLIEANLIRDNDGHGIRLDNARDGSRVTRNVVLGNQTAGIFVETGSGQIDNNVIGYTRAGDGIYAKGASGVTIAHNLLYGNAGFGVSMQMAKAGNLAANNILIDNNYGHNNIVLKLNRSMLASRVLNLELELDEAAAAGLKCPAVEGVETDFFGDRIPRSTPVLAGPFQRLRPGWNAFTLW